MTDTTITPEHRTWIAKHLIKTPFVTWDRYTLSTRNNSRLIQIYGWIDRDDTHEDFVVVRFWPEQEWFEFTTSSDEYSKELHRIWFGGDEIDDHNPCRRVENTFDIENMIEL